jgi:hypothetical protein
VTSSAEVGMLGMLGISEYVNGERIGQLRVLILQSIVVRTKVGEARDEQFYTTFLPGMRGN